MMRNILWGLLIQVMAYIQPPTRAHPALLSRRSEATGTRKCWEQANSLSCDSYCGGGLGWGLARHIRGIFSGILLIVLLCMAQRPMQVYANAPITPEQYWEVIKSASEQTAAGERQAAADALAVVTSVALPNGTVNIDNSALIANLRDETVSDDIVASDLLELSDSSVFNPTDSSADRAKLHEILSRPPFIGRSTNAFEAWLRALLDQLFAGGSGINADLRPFIIGIGAILLIGVLFYTLRGLRGNFSPDATVGHDPEVPATSAEALTRAQTLANAGDHRAAVRQLYIATLLLLDEKGRLRFDKSLTNRELLRAIQRQNAPELAEALRPIAGFYDQVWYGFTPVGQHEFDDYRSQVEAVRTT